MFRSTPGSLSSSVLANALANFVGQSDYELWWTKVLEQSLRPRGGKRAGEGRREKKVRDLTIL